MLLGLSLEPLCGWRLFLPPVGEEKVPKAVVGES